MALMGRFPRSLHRGIALVWVRLGQRVRQRWNGIGCNQRVLENDNLPLAGGALLCYQSRPCLDMLFLPIEVPHQIGSDKYHSHIGPQ